jgi:hypothetical protein
MSDDEFGVRLGRSIDARVGRARPRSDVGDLLTQSEELRRRLHRRVLAVMTVVVVLVGALGYLVGTSVGEGDETTAVVVPRAPNDADVYAPDDLARASIEISQAYRDVFGPSTDDVKAASMQLGPELLPVLHRSAEIAQRFGYTKDQLKGNVVTVSAPSFIDATHAIVRFSITIPDHGTKVKDRTGYAVRSDGRWQVAARTVCDIVWPGTTSPACPARAAG